MSVTTTELAAAPQPAVGLSGYRSNGGGGVPVSRPVSSRVLEPRRRPTVPMHDSSGAGYRISEAADKPLAPPGGEQGALPPPRSPSPTKPLAATPIRRPPSSPAKRAPSRGRSASRRRTEDLTDPSDPPRSKSRLEYLGFEEYDGGKLSQVSPYLMLHSVRCSALNK